MTQVMNRRSVLAGGLGAAALLIPGATVAAQSSDAERANVKLVTDFCAAISAKDLNKALASFAADGVYRVTETAMPVTGPDGVRSRLATLIEQSQRVEWEIHESWAKGPMVINHRTDRFVNPARPFTWEGVGVFFIADGRIKEWHDYTIRTQRG
jgi:limonene-1,2-epoxide hydrolase